MSQTHDSANEKSIYEQQRKSIFLNVQCCCCWLFKFTIINCGTTDINLELLLNVSDSRLCKWLDFLVFSDKDEKLQVPFHNNFSYLVLVGCERTHTTVLKERGMQTPVVCPAFPGLGGLSVSVLVDRVYMYSEVAQSSLCLRVYNIMSNACLLVSDIVS